MVLPRCEPAIRTHQICACVCRIYNFYVIWKLSNGEWWTRSCSQLREKGIQPTPCTNEWNVFINLTTSFCADMMSPNRIADKLLIFVLILILICSLTSFLGPGWWQVSPKGLRRGWKLRALLRIVAASFSFDVGLLKVGHRRIGGTGDGPIMLGGLYRKRINSIRKG